MNHAEAIEWLREAARYFAKRDTGGEDRTHWSNVSNSESACAIAQLIEEDSWRPIFTADMSSFRSGDSVILYVPGHGEVRARVVAIGASLVWGGWHSNTIIQKASHWKPLSVPPPVKESLTTAKKDSRETQIARHMLARTIEKYSTVDDFAEILRDKPEEALSFLSSAALQVVRNPYKFQ